MGEIAGRAVYVAGATGVIGSAVCTALAHRGARLVVHYHRARERAEQLVEQLGAAGQPGHVAVGADLRAAAELERSFKVAESSLGPVGALVNAYHPVHTPADVAVLSASGLGDQLDAVRVHLALCQRALAGMRAARWGRIVYVSGALMTRPAPGFAAYAAAKAAATTLTRYLAMEEGRHGITANVVAPGRVVDPASGGADAGLDAEHAALAAKLRERLALGEFPSPGQVAAVVATLVDELGDSVTGQTMWVTGGEPIG